MGKKGVRLCKELTSRFLWRCVLAEFLGSTFYSFIINTVTLNLYAIDPVNDPLSSTWRANPMYVLKVALAIGFGVISVANIFEIPYGGFMNPAVTFGALACWRISFVTAAMYILVQFGGGITGVAIVYGVTPKSYHHDLGIPRIGKLSEWRAFGMEGTLSIVVVLTVLAATDKNRKYRDSFGPALAYGSAVAAMHIIGIPYTGCGLNPARVLGSCVLSSEWPPYIWIYWAGPIAGGVLAGIIYLLVFAVSPLIDDTSSITTNDLLNSYIVEQMPPPPASNKTDSVKQRNKSSLKKGTATSRYSSNMVFMNTNI